MTIARKKTLICLFLVAATAVVYVQTLWFDFISLDDYHYVTQNLLVQSGLGADSVARTFTSSYMSNWHPLTWMSLMLDYEIFGLNPGGYHLTNTLFHMANSVLLFIVFNRMTRALWPSAFIAAVFALHPLHVESVAWIAERKDVLSTFFWILTMWAYAVYAEKPSVKRYAPVMVLLWLGLMSKAMLVTLPCVLLLMDLWPLGRIKNLDSIKRPGGLKILRNLVIEKIPLFVLIIISSYVTFIAQQKGGATTSLDLLPVWARLSNAFTAYMLYIWKTLYPTGLAIFYPYSEDTLIIWRAVAGVLIVLITSIAVVWQLRRRPYLSVGWFWFVGTLVPVIGIVQVGLQSMADRYMYVPMIGLTIMVAWGAREFFHACNINHRTAAAVAGMIVAALIAMSFVQTSYWRSNIALYSHAITVTQDNYFIYKSLGDAFADEGDNKKAIENYMEAIRITPYFAGSYRGLGMLLMEEGKLDEASHYISKAANMTPGHTDAHLSMAVLLSEQGRYKEAEEKFKLTVDLNPYVPDLYVELGITLAEQGKYEEAIAQYKRTLSLAPDNADAYNNLGVAYYRQGRIDLAIESLKTAIKHNDALSDAHYNLGIAYGDKGETALAYEEMQKAITMKE